MPWEACTPVFLMEEIRTKDRALVHLFSGSLKLLAVSTSRSSINGCHFDPLEGLALTFVSPVLQFELWSRFDPPLSLSCSCPSEWHECPSEKINIGRNIELLNSIWLVIILMKQWCRCGGAKTSAARWSLVSKMQIEVRKVKTRVMFSAFNHQLPD